MEPSNSLLPLKLVVLAILATPVLCRPTGAPMSACVNMRPGHGNQSSLPEPYTIHVTDKYNRKVYYYYPGQWLKVKVKLTGTREFRGILMQMREVGQKVPIGTWGDVAANTRRLTCTRDRDSVTHKNIEYKGDSEFIWKAPKDRWYRRLQVRATIAAEFTTWWRGVTSHTITFTSGVAPSYYISGYALLLAVVLSNFLTRLSM